jgi:hypothetical protein
VLLPAFEHGGKKKIEAVVYFGKEDRNNGVFIAILKGSSGPCTMK